jgi:hypothetical protein
MENFVQEVVRVRERDLGMGMNDMILNEIITKGD